MGIKFIYTNNKGDSLEFSKESGIWITEFDGLSSNDVEISDSTVLQQVGSSITGRSVQPKDQTAEGVIRYDPSRPKRIHDLRRLLLAVVLPAVDATLRYINTDAGIDVYWNGTPKRTPVLGNNPTIQKFQFTFFCPYPYPRETEKNQTGFNTTRSTFRFPQSYSSTVAWKISEKDHTPQRTVDNRGTISTGFTLTMEADAEVKNPAFTNVYSQEKISFSGLTMQAGDVLEICTRPNENRATLISGGVSENVFYLMDFDSVFFTLPPGESVLRYSASTNEASLRATLVFENTFAGV